MHHDQRRIGATLVSHAQLDATAVDHRRLVRLGGVLQQGGQTLGRPAGHGAFEGAVDGRVEVTHRSAVQRGDEVQVSVVGKAQTTLDLGAHLLLGFAFQAIPLVDHQHQRAAAGQHEVQQVQVLLDQSLAGIEHHHGDVALLDRFQRLDDGELLHHFAHVLATTDPGGIDQQVRLATTLEGNFHGVGGGAGLVIDDHALLAQQAIDQRRLADVRATDDADAHAAIIQLRVQVLVFAFLDFGVGREHLFQQCGDVAAVLGGDGARVTQTQGPEVGLADLLVHAVGLVDHQPGLLLVDAQVIGDGLIRHVQTGARIDHEQHDVGFVDGGQ